MRGLKTPESDKFCRFHELVESEAEKKGGVFFGFSGEGRAFVTPEMEGEDLSGWLVPNDKADEFESLWKREPVEKVDAWSEFFVFVIWHLKGDKVSVEFKTF